MVSYTLAKYPYRLPLRVIECKIPILFLNISYIHSPALPPFTYILELMTSSQQRPSWLSWQSVALDSWGREILIIFRHWSRLSLYTALVKYPYRLPLLCIYKLYTEKYVTRR